MSAMIRIGDFARMAGTSVATLRLYDEQDLLRPVEVDPRSGYRYYTPAQLVDLNRIHVLKDLGFSLREIRSITQDNIKPQGLAELLAEKRSATERKLQKERQKIKQLELQIRIIQGLQTMTIADVTTLTVPEMTVAAIHLEIPTNEQVGPLLGSAFGRLFETIGRQGITPLGSCLAVWSSTPDIVTDEIVDAVVPISSGLTPEGDVREQVLPSVKVATVTHRGPFSEFQTCHIVLRDWLAQNQYRLAGPYREIYHSPPGDDAVTEVQYPIAPLA